MTYEEFLEFIPAKCMYETIYDDSNGHPILVIRMLDAYGMVNKLTQPTWFVDSKLNPPQRTWVGLMRGARVEGDTVVIKVKGGNDAARELCGELLNEMGVRNDA